MEGTISNYRQGRHRQKPKQMVIIVQGYSDKEKAKALIGKSVTWASPAGKELKGKITGSHGNSGAVKAMFEIGMPGQAVGTKVKIQ